MRSFALLIALTTCSASVHAQMDVKVWTRLAGTGGIEDGFAVATDPSGNCILAGETQGALFGSNQGARDLFIAKYNTNGSLLWGRQRGTSERDCAFGVATDAAGNIYATGFAGAALDGQYHAGKWDIILTKYGPSGDWLWTRLIGSANDDEGYAVTTDASGNVYLTGYIRGDIHGQVRVGSADVILCKYSPSGTRLWTRLFGSIEIDQAWAIACDAQGNVIVSGYALGSIESNPFLANGDLFLAKYDTNGNRLWLRQWGTWNAEHGYSLDTDAEGNIYLSGYTTGDLYGPRSGGRDVFLAKFDASGNPLWGRQFGCTPGLGTNEHDQGWGVALGADGNIYLTGQVEGPLDGNPYLGGLDIFLAKYDPAGNRLWSQQLGTALSDAARGGVATTTTGAIFLAGTTSGNLDGNPNQGSTDAFVIKFAPPLPPDPPTAAQATPPTISIGGSSVLSAIPGSGGDTVEWFVGSCGGTPVPGGASPTVSPTATTTYYARTRNSATGLTSLTCAVATVTVTLPETPGDLDRDGDVDLADFASFQYCFSGPNQPLREPACAVADLDADNDVDLADFAAFQRCFNGPNRPPGC